MPLPFLLIVPAVVAALWGVKKSAAAVNDSSQARDLNRQAKEIFTAAQKRMEIQKAATKGALESLGKTKLRVWKNHMGRFIRLFSRLRNVDIDKRELPQGIPDALTRESLLEMQRVSVKAAEVLGGGLAALGAGGLAGFGALTGTMMFASASTGTAISALSGVAATNATLAWFGGGAIAAGGTGMAGGVIVLGGIVTGPALLVGGFIISAKARAKLAAAKANIEKAREAEAALDLVTVALRGIAVAAVDLEGVIKRLGRSMTRSLGRLERVLAEQSPDYALFSEDQRRVVLLAASFAGLMKQLLDTAVLTEDGAVDPGMATKVERVKDSAEPLLRAA